MKGSVLILLLYIWENILGKKIERKKIHTLLVIKMPTGCKESMHNNEILLSKEGSVEEKKLGLGLSERYKKFIQTSIKSSKNVYAIAANTSCHYQSTDEFLRGMLKNVDESRFVSGDEDYLPLSVLRDYSDTLFQLRTCDVLRKEIGEDSFRNIIRYRNDPVIKKVIEKIKNMKIVSENENLKNLIFFEFFEHFYSELKLNSPNKLSHEEEYLVSKVYELFMYSHYFASHLTTVSFIKPFVGRINSMLEGLKTREKNDGELKKRKKLLVFTASEKLMLGIFNSFLNITHSQIYKEIKEFMNNSQIVERSHNILSKSPKNFIIEIFEKNEKKFVKGFNFLELESLILNPYQRDDKLYAVEGLLDGKIVNICGPFVNGECLLIDLIEFAFIDFYLINAKFCELRDNLRELERKDYFEDFLFFVIIFETGVIISLLIQIKTKERGKEEKEHKYEKLTIIN